MEAILLEPVVLEAAEHRQREQLSLAPPISAEATGNLAQSFWQVSQRSPRSPLVITSEGFFSYEWAQGAALAVRGALLSSRDYQPGTPTGLLLDNSPEYVAAYYGILLAEGVVVPLPPRLEQERWNRVRETCDLQWIITRETDGGLQHLPASSVIRRLNLQDYNEATHPCPIPVHRSGSDLAMIVFTSGSTGEPKGVMLSHRNLLANTASILAYLPIRPDDRTLAVLPFCHAFGNSIMHTHVLAGASLIIGGPWTLPDSLIEALRSYRATSLSTVPEAYSMLLRFTRLGADPLPDLRYMTVAGGAMDPEMAQVVAGRIAPARFYVMYGQSEATARLSYLPPEELPSRPGSIGKGIPGVELKVADESGHAVSPGQIGMLQARGDNVTSGYWRDPEETAKVVRNGWLETGDLATVDADGYIYLRGRANLLTKVQGHRVHPREVEEVITRTLPGVQAAVVAYQSSGQNRLAMFAVPPPGQVVEVSDLRAICHRKLPRHKVPSHIEILEQLPLNPALKVDRLALARRLVPTAKSAA